MSKDAIIEYLRRYRRDINFRLAVNLALTLAVNVIYSAFKLIAAIYFSSNWQGAVGVYYAILSIIRFTLLWSVRKTGIGGDYESDLKKYRVVGLMLVMLTVALSAMAVLMIRDNKHVEYPGSLIFLASLWAFYNVSVVIVQLVRHRKNMTPISAASRAISFSAALVSLLSLQTSLLARFADQSTAFVRAMNIRTALIVILIILFISVFMTVGSTKALRDINSDGQE
ncbi:MAG: hypothetical protein II794_07315 [Oscillospiraceae bacterium]|nr:hypothetical protein [Oscillospiraceae bacterium]